MAVINLPTSWSDGQVLTASALNGNFSTIVNDYNGDITNANIAPAAAIAWSKLSTAGSALDDLGDVTITGATSGQVLKWNGVAWVNGTAGAVSYGSLLPGVLSVTNDLGINPRVRLAATVSRISGYVKTPPIGADLIVQVYNITQAQVVATLTITAGSSSATSTVIANNALTAGDILRFDCTQVGSGTPGSNCTLQIDGSE